MPSKVFINLAVKDLPRSLEFFGALGFSVNPDFTNEQGACLVISEGSIYAMLLVEPFFKGFTKKEICNAHTHTEVLIALDVNSREEVDEMVRKAVEAGGSTYMEPQDHGWMYQHSFADPDGHQWEICFMDESKLPQP